MYKPNSVVRRTFTLRGNAGRFGSSDLVDLLTGSILFKSSPKFFSFIVDCAGM